MKTSLFFASLSATFVFTSVSLPAADPKGDENFVHAAAQGGMLEVRLGKIAEKKAVRADVKEFGAMMASDHGKAGEKLKTVAAKKGLSIAPGLDAKHEAMVEKLDALPSGEFDKAYVTAMVKDHEEDVEEFRKAAKTAADPEVKAFAEETLPVIEKHLVRIKEISQEEKKK